jgi:hypothetical protein
LTADPELILPTKSSSSDKALVNAPENSQHHEELESEIISDWNPN